MTAKAPNLTPAQVATALRHHYTPPSPGKGHLVEGQKLIELLQALPALTLNDHVDTIMVQLDKHHKGIELNPDDRALLCFVDDCITHILRQTDLDFKIESFVRDLAPSVAILGLRDGVDALTRPQPILTLIDLLISECIGWSEDLGILGEQFISKVESRIRSMVHNHTSIEEGLSDLQSFFHKEAQTWHTMEERLCQSQLKELAGQKAKYYATDLLNKEMAGKQLPLFIIFMLQGSWFEFLQQVFIHHGKKSREWERAEKLTNALVWSLQPQENKDKHESIMSTLPGHISTFCEKLDFDTTQFEQSIADIESEYDAIRSGKPSDPCDFELMEIDSKMTDDSQISDPDALKQIESFTAGQWFLYDDKSESEERIARIKLILNWHDTGRLLFTNHNRRKVLHMNYGELTEYLARGTVQPLTPKESAFEIIKTHLLRVVRSVSQQKKKEKQAPETTERQVISEEYISKRKAALDKAQEQHRQHAAEKEQRAKLLRQKAQQKLDAANAAVAGLNVNAWVKLPLMQGTLTPCKLVARIPANDKYIFANRAGIKVAEYTSSQLAHMIVMENSEILDTGEEFEGVLASVVSGLRSDRNKSYDELTGDMA